MIVKSASDQPKSPPAGRGHSPTGEAQPAPPGIGDPIGAADAGAPVPAVNLANALPYGNKIVQKVKYDPRF